MVGHLNAFQARAQQHFAFKETQVKQTNNVKLRYYETRRKLGYKYVFVLFYSVLMLITTAG